MIFIDFQDLLKQNVLKEAAVKTEVREDVKRIEVKGEVLETRKEVGTEARLSRQLEEVEHPSL